jgi:hypothetical protein
VNAGLARFQPVDETALSIAAAIDAVAAEQAALTAKIAALRDERSAVLLTGTIKAVVAVEAAMREAEIDLERWNILAPQLAPRLAVARAAERDAAIEAKRLEVTAKLDAANVWWRDEYPGLATAIADGLRKCHGAEWAAWEFGNLLAGRPLDAPPIDRSLPGPPRTNLVPYGPVAPHRCVQLPPAATGSALWWPADLLGRPRHPGG